MRGSAENNIAVAGDDGMIWHYNGANWRLLNDVGSGVPLYSVVVSDNMIVAVGADFNVTDIFPPEGVSVYGAKTMNYLYSNGRRLQANQSLKLTEPAVGDLTRAKQATTCWT